MNNLLLMIFVADKNMTDSKEHITGFTRAKDKIPCQYEEERVSKTIRCGVLFEKQALNDVFLKVPDKYISHSRREYWALRRTRSLQDFVISAMSLLELHSGRWRQSPSTADKSKSKNLQLKLGQLDAWFYLISFCVTRLYLFGMKFESDANILIISAVSFFTTLASTELLPYTSRIRKAWTLKWINARHATLRSIYLYKILSVWMIKRWDWSISGA